MFQKMGFISSAFLLGLLLQSTISYADEARGLIVKNSGVVKITSAKGKVREVTGSNVEVREMDTVSTGEDGKAVVMFNDGALTVLDQKSSLQIDKKNWLSHLGGKIYFTFRKVFSGQRQVKTKFSTIGIRGTTFIVYDNKEEGAGVALKEGKLELVSTGDNYEIHRQKSVDNFKAFKQQAEESRKAMKSEYDDYKKNTMEEFVEYKNSFTMEANHVIRFDGNRVDETAMSEKERASFDDFESIAGEMLESFRKQSKQLNQNQENR